LRAMPSRECDRQEIQSHVRWCYQVLRGSVFFRHEVCGDRCRLRELPLGGGWRRQDQGVLLETVTPSNARNFLNSAAFHRSGTWTTVLYKDASHILQHGWDAAVSSAGNSAVGFGFEPKPSNVYLIEERKPKMTFELLDQSLSSGYTALIITRDYPKKLLSEKEIGCCRVDRKSVV